MPTHGRSQAEKSITVRLPSGDPWTISKLLTWEDENVKLNKSAHTAYMMVGLSLAPADVAEHGNLCPNHSPACLDNCLFWSGHAQVFKSVRNGRIAKTVAFFKYREWFLEKLREEISLGALRAERAERTLVVRLNMFSDIVWEKVYPRLFRDFPGVQFEDYTKQPRRMLRWLAGKLPPNYHLTFSRSETNEEFCREILSGGGNVAAVFHRELPETWEGYPVVDGDVSDLRFLDPPGVVVGLRAKGPARKDESGFSISLPMVTETRYETV